jgi:hypothetical protein
MIEALQHMIGACGDNHSHIDLTDMLYMGGGAMGIYTLKYYIYCFFILIKSYINDIL